MQRLREDIAFFLKQKLFMIMLCITAIGCYGFSITHEGIGVDDVIIEEYFGRGLAVIHGRWTLFLLNRLFHFGEYIPFITELAGMLLLIVSSVIFCVLLRRLLGGAITGSLCYTVFACTFVSCPFISETNVYYCHNGADLGYGLCALALILFLDSLDHKGKKYIVLMLGSLLLLWAAVGCYESFLIMYIVGVLLILFFRGITDQEKITFKLLMKSLLSIICLAVGCIVLRTIIRNVICFLFSIQETSSENGFRSVGYLIKNLFESENFLSEVAMLLKRYWLIYCVNGVVYFPVTVYMVSAIAFGTASVVYAVKKKNFWYPILFIGMMLAPVTLTFLQMTAPLYRTCQYMPLFVASAVVLLYLALVNQRWKKIGTTVYVFLIAALVWNQAFETNRNFYVDYMKYEYDKKTLIGIAQEISKEYGTGMLVIFTGDYYPPYELVKYYYAPYYSSEFRRIQAVAQLSGDQHLVEKYYTPYGYYFGGEAQFSVIDWGLWAFGKPGDQLVRFLEMHGYSLRTTEDETILKRAQDFAETMPRWPTKGSITEMDGYVIVHF